MSLADLIHRAQQAFQAFRMAQPSTYSLAHALRGHYDAPLPASGDTLEPTQGVEEKVMAFGWLKTAGKEIGKDAKAVFAWITSSKGQAVIAAGEGVAVSLGAPAALVNIANYWINKAITVEGIAAAAGEQEGSGPLKAAAVLADVTPYVLQIAKQNGLPEPSSDNIAKANTALVTFLNALGAASDVTQAQQSTAGAILGLAPQQQPVRA